MLVRRRSVGSKRNPLPFTYPTKASQLQPKRGNSCTQATVVAVKGRLSLDDISSLQMYMAHLWSVYGCFDKIDPYRNLGSRSSESIVQFHVFYGQLPIVSIYYVYIPYKLWPIDHNPYCLCTTKFLWARDHSFKKLAKQNPNHETQMNEVIYYRYNTFLLQFAGIWYLVNIHSFYGQNICSFALDAAAMSG